MKNNAKKLLDIISSEEMDNYAKIKALNKLSGNTEIDSIGYDSKYNFRNKKKNNLEIDNIVVGTEKIGISPADEGGKWKELKLNNINSLKSNKNGSLFNLTDSSPSEFKKYFRDAETGRSDLESKREQSKKAMPSSAKSMIQKYIKSKNGEKK